MKRLQILIDEDLDDALELRVRKEKTSKAALIRRYVRERLEPLPSLEHDPLLAWVGGGEGEPHDSVSVDDVVYPR